MTTDARPGQVFVDMIFIRDFESQQHIKFAFQPSGMDDALLVSLLAKWREVVGIPPPESEGSTQIALF
jgi:hypothetical protein